MMASTSCWHVNRKELTPGGIVSAISAISSSGIGPGPLGIADTSPTADAPCSIAIQASSILAMQQTLIRGLNVARISPDTFLQIHRIIPAAFGFLAIVSQKLKHNSAKEKDNG